MYCETLVLTHVLTFRSDMNQRGAGSSNWKPVSKRQTQRRIKSAVEAYFKNSTNQGKIFLSSKVYILKIVLHVSKHVTILRDFCFCHASRYFQWTWCQFLHWVTQYGLRAAFITQVERQPSTRPSKLWEHFRDILWYRADLYASFFLNFLCFYL